MIMKIKANFVDDKKEIDESNIVNVGQKKYTRMM